MATRLRSLRFSNGFRHRPAAEIRGIFRLREILAPCHAPKGIHNVGSSGIGGLAIQQLADWLCPESAPPVVATDSDGIIRQSLRHTGGYCSYRALLPKRAPQELLIVATLSCTV